MEQYPGFPAPDFAPSGAPQGAPAFGGPPMPPDSPEPQYSPIAQHLLAGAQGPPVDPLMARYRPSQPPPDQRVLQRFQTVLAAFGHA